MILTVFIQVLIVVSSLYSGILVLWFSKKHKISGIPVIGVLLLLVGIGGLYTMSIGSHTIPAIRHLLAPNIRNFNQFSW